MVSHAVVVNPAEEAKGHDPAWGGNSKEGLKAIEGTLEGVVHGDGGAVVVNEPLDILKIHGQDVSEDSDVQIEEGSEESKRDGERGLDVSVGLLFVGSFVFLVRLVVNKVPSEEGAEKNAVSKLSHGHCKDWVGLVLSIFHLVDFVLNRDGRGVSLAFWCPGGIWLLVKFDVILLEIIITVFRSVNFQVVDEAILADSVELGAL